MKPQIIIDAAAKETEFVGPFPKRWLTPKNKLYRCENGHVRYVWNICENRPVCLECSAKVYLTFPEDVECIGVIG